jgi:hypothetical protein
MTISHSSVTDDSARPALSGADRAVPVLAAISAVAALVALGVAGWIGYETYSYVPRPHEDVSLHGLGYIMAALIAVPAGVALLLAALGWWLGRRGLFGWGIGVTVTALVMMAPFALIAVAFLR